MAIGHVDQFGMVHVDVQEYEAFTQAHTQLERKEIDHCLPTLEKYDDPAAGNRWPACMVATAFLNSKGKRHGCMVKKSWLDAWRKQAC